MRRGVGRPVDLEDRKLGPERLERSQENLLKKFAVAVSLSLWTLDPKREMRTCIYSDSELLVGLSSWVRQAHATVSSA